jgi:hypothetical protein
MDELGVTNKNVIKITISVNIDNFRYERCVIRNNNLNV